MKFRHWLMAALAVMAATVLTERPADASTDQAYEYIAMCMTLECEHPCGDTPIPPPKPPTWAGPEEWLDYYELLAIYAAESAEWFACLAVWVNPPITCADCGIIPVGHPVDPTPSECLQWTHTWQVYIQCVIDNGC